MDTGTVNLKVGKAVNVQTEEHTIFKKQKLKETQAEPHYCGK